jgi:predicted nucleic acid-binding protein
MEGKSKQVLEDALIAATARVYALTVATRNERDFEPLGVSIYNPFMISP